VLNYWVRNFKLFFLFFQEWSNIYGHDIHEQSYASHGWFCDSAQQEQVSCYKPFSLSYFYNSRLKLYEAVEIHKQSNVVQDLVYYFSPTLNLVIALVASDYCSSCENLPLDYFFLDLEGFTILVLGNILLFHPI